MYSIFIPLRCGAVAGNKKALGLHADELGTKSQGMPKNDCWVSNPA